MNCMSSSKEDYLWDIGGERVKELLIVLIFLSTVPLFASVTIKWLFGKPGIQRIVLGISSASQVIGRFQNGEFGCYKDGLLTEMECHRHFSLTVNASSEIIIAITNISDSFFGNYIVSIYRGPDDKIDTLWIIVYKKGKLSAFCFTLEYTICAVSRGCNRHLTNFLLCRIFTARYEFNCMDSKGIPATHVTYTYRRSCHHQHEQVQWTAS